MSVLIYSAADLFVLVPGTDKIGGLDKGSSYLVCKSPKMTEIKNMSTIPRKADQVGHHPEKQGPHPQSKSLDWVEKSAAGTPATAKYTTSAEVAYPKASQRHYYNDWKMEI